MLRTRSASVGRARSRSVADAKTRVPMPLQTQAPCQTQRGQSSTPADDDYVARARSMISISAVCHSCACTPLAFVSKKPSPREPCACSGMRRPFSA